MKTAQYSKVEFREVFALNARLVSEPDSWPQDLRWVLASFRENHRQWDKDHWHKAGELLIYASPRFFLVHRAKLIQVTLGDYWKWEMVPAIANLVGP